jgi:hypothetical protein
MIEWFSLCMGDENRVPQPLITTRDNLFGVTWYDLEIGMAQVHWNASSILYSDEKECDGDPDDMLANDLGLPVFSERLRKELAKAAIATEDFQFLPVRVALSTGREFGGFAIANILSRVPALDPDHSFMLDIDEDEIDPLTEKAKVTGIGRAALRADALQNHDVIRLLEFFPAIYVSRRFRDIFNQNGFTGATFYPLEVFD